MLVRRSCSHAVCMPPCLWLLRSRAAHTTARCQRAHASTHARARPAPAPCALRARCRTRSRARLTLSWWCAATWWRCARTKIRAWARRRSRWTSRCCCRSRAAARSCSSRALGFSSASARCARCEQAVARAAPAADVSRRARGVVGAAAAAAAGCEGAWASGHAAAGAPARSDDRHWPRVLCAIAGRAAGAGGASLTCWCRVVCCVCTMYVWPLCYVVVLTCRAQRCGVDGASPSHKCTQCVARPLSGREVALALSGSAPIQRNEARARKHAKAPITVHTNTC